jgi:dCMP deaminase
MIDNKTGMLAARNFASAYSDDLDTQTGCAIFDRRGVLVASGSNKLPLGITKTEKRITRPDKYSWIEHAERTAIYQTVSTPITLVGTTMFLNWFPCADCARAIVAVGIQRLVYMIKPERMADPRYGFEASTEILKAAGVELVEYKD